MNEPTGDGPSIHISATDFDLPEERRYGLAKYANFREISRGATSLLRSGFDTVIGRTVAIKTLLPEANNRRENKRLLREARITAQLQHPNTVPVYEIGKDIEDGLYFTMKRVSGENFFQILKRIAQGDLATIQEFSIARRVEIAEHAAQALAYAHARGVIHRDVKPENIWVGNFGEVILLDWGVAKVWGQSDEDIAESQPAGGDQSLTQAGQRPGTPLYMSPEQVENRMVDERSDIFSMGVVLYEILVVREPFRGRVVEETFDNILHLDPEPPSQRAPEAGISSEVDAVVMKALSKRPADRHQSMGELIRDLRSLMGRRLL